MVISWDWVLPYYSNYVMLLCYIRDSVETSEYDSDSIFISHQKQYDLIGLNESFCPDKQFMAVCFA